VDARVIGSEQYINNSGLVVEYTRSFGRGRLELRPLLKSLELRGSPHLKIQGHGLGILLAYTRAIYSLPSYSEDLRRYEFLPYLEREGWLSYRFSAGYSSKEYPSSPIKSQRRWKAQGRTSLKVDMGTFVHRFKIVGEISRVNYPGISEPTGGVEEMSSFEYTPEIFNRFILRMGVSRTLNLYQGAMRSQSMAYRDMIVGGRLNWREWNVYLRRRREDYVLIDASRSSDTRTLIRYLLGTERFWKNLTFASEIVAIYTLYRFKPADNSLYRYLDLEMHYRKEKELHLRLRFWDRGRFVADSSIYYRLIRKFDIYSSGWIPAVSLGKGKVGLTYEVRPDNVGVGVASRFPGGEMAAMKRKEKGKEFWNFSLKVSLNF